MPIKKIPFKPIYKFQQTHADPTANTNEDRILNPWKGWRKVNANIPPLTGTFGNCSCDSAQSDSFNNQQVFTDPNSIGQSILDCITNGKCNLGVCCPPKTRPNQIPTSVKNSRSYSFDYRQYLKKKCKGLYAKSFQHNLNTVTHLGAPQCYDGSACFGHVCSPAPTIYKPNNTKYSKQGAVSSSARLLRLKTDMKQGCAGNHPCWTKPNGTVQNNYPKSQVTIDSIMRNKYGRAYYPPPVLSKYNGRQSHYNSGQINYIRDEIARGLAK